MRYRVGTVLALAALAVVPFHEARAQSQTEMNIQADKDFRRTNARLLSVYGQVRAALNAAGRKRLSVSEQAWITYREAQSELEAGQYQGGSMEPMVALDTKTRITQARIKELQHFEADLTSR